MKRRIERTAWIMRFRFFWPRTRVVRYLEEKFGNAISRRIAIRVVLECGW